MTSQSPARPGAPGTAAAMSAPIDAATAQQLSKRLESLVWRPIREDRMAVLRHSRS